MGGEGVAGGQQVCEGEAHLNAAALAGADGTVGGGGGGGRCVRVGAGGGGDEGMGGGGR